MSGWSTRTVLGLAAGLILGLLATPRVAAQELALGFRAGEAVSHIQSGFASPWAERTRTGLSLSAVVIVPLNDMLDFQFEPGVTRKGQGRGEVDPLLAPFTNETWLTYLSFPLLIRWNGRPLIEGAAVRPIAFGGPAIAVRLACRHSQDTRDLVTGAFTQSNGSCEDLNPCRDSRRPCFPVGLPFAELEPFDLAAVLGVGIEIAAADRWRGTLDVRYEHSAYSVSRLDEGARNRAWIFSVGFFYIP